jgi:hypothetical protein
MAMQQTALVLSLLTVTMVLALAMSLSKGVFVGAFTADGQPIPLATPTKGQWVSAEQVRRELVFRRWQPPLTTEQMATLARNLDADFAMDVLAAAKRLARCHRFAGCLCPAQRHRPLAPSHFAPLFPRCPR